ncbi:polyhydroxyalkanoate biosynthesis repressor PhaR [Desertibacillus haloalkaliphilus]|uniref:polyhydroxyalkanoate biosynthesis repressor PhaR n=1 Tax=Desertibacillus haloalkaliphilus TaxID=1328930 RepID=UPI001C261982|nr:polyhydroxyalkanoate biosynthesis repressor PhaR [Desertibacillus haloalkaliphilus]MBU8907554.1 polyhydroxyalkanoate biosynthesis repressor PhaR [Desertibacillus haloalkaliphilus]
MSSYDSYEPFDLFKKVSHQWEKQMNDMIHLWTNNNEFVRYSRMTSDSQARYLDLFKKNQEMVLNQLNLPSKRDISNVSKMIVQTEEKLDTLEEQVWSVSDSVSDTQTEVEEVIKVSKEVIKVTKQIKTELTKTKKQLAETTAMQTEIQELKAELAEMRQVNEDVQSIKKLLTDTNNLNEDTAVNGLVGTSASS